MTLVRKVAPDFKTISLSSNGDFKQIGLSNYKGKWVCLFFYPLDFTFVCPTEITAFNQTYDDFKEANCEILGCSVDSHFSHLAWSKIPIEEGGVGKLKFSLLSDITKKIAHSYGVLDDESGITLRALFLIDPEGIVRYEVIHDLNIGRNPKEVLRVLQALEFSSKSGDVCPASWEPGEKTIKPDPVKSKDYFKSNYNRK